MGNRIKMGGFRTDEFNLPMRSEISVRQMKTELCTHDWDRRVLTVCGRKDRLDRRPKLNHSWKPISMNPVLFTRQSVL